MVNYSSSQLSIINHLPTGKVFLDGSAGTGKTTAGVGHLLHLITQGVPASTILLLVPQRTLATPYTSSLNTPEIAAGGLVSVVTIGGLAQRMVNLFWPMVADRAGFANPTEPPIFLNLETAQYYMARLVRPLLEEGYFSSVAITPNRLYSQILDNLNKSALVGFPYTEIGQRLKDAWVGEASQAHVYDDAQECANRFRRYCLEHNLLDFSLEVEVFTHYLWREQLCRDLLRTTYRHLIMDNVEEDTPVAHDILQEWLPDFDSALIIFDQDAGYRRFLGADPSSGWNLRRLCSEQINFDETFVTPPNLHTFASFLGKALGMESKIPEVPIKHLPISDFNVPLGIAFPDVHFFPQMLDWATEQIAELVLGKHTPPGEIAVLAPYFSDALRFSLANRLERLGIPTRSHRPSRALREESATQCLLTLSALAHPAWRICPSKFDVAYALMQAIEGTDLVRAQLLAEIVYRIKEGQPTLGSFEAIKQDVQERITYLVGQRFEKLRAWIASYLQLPELEYDYFLSRLFGEVLSQAGFGFHHNYTAGEAAANLVDSARNFRWAITPSLSGEPHGCANHIPIGKEYLKTVQDGVVAGQYLRSWQPQPEDAVLLAPAYTFLVNNRPVDYQVWLDVSSRGWSERLYQPLTQPYVLSRQWSSGDRWTEENEFRTNQEVLYRLVLGLIRRCRRKIYLGFSELNEQGNDQVGPLLKALDQAIRQMEGWQETL
jgi:hypothetical protein